MRIVEIKNQDKQKKNTFLQPATQIANCRDNKQLSLEIITIAFLQLTMRIVDSGNQKIKLSKVVPTILFLPLPLRVLIATVDFFQNLRPRLILPLNFRLNISNFLPFFTFFKQRI